MHAAHGMSLVGTKITYLKDKFADSTTVLLVADYCSVQGENNVFEIGKKGATFRDLKKLMDTHPSCSIEAISHEDMTEDVTAFLDPPGKRKAAVSAGAKISVQEIDQQYELQPEDESNGQQPRRRRRMTRQGGLCV